MVGAEDFLTSNWPGACECKRKIERLIRVVVRNARDARVNSISKMTGGVVNK